MALPSLLARSFWTATSIAWIVAGASGPALAQCETAKLTAPVPFSSDAFGIGVALDGDTALVAASETSTSGVRGVALVYTWDGSDWSRQALLDNHGMGNGAFAVALEGDTAVVGGGNIQACIPHVGTGVTVYERTGSTWSLVQQLATPPGSDTPRIGHSVDLSGDTIVVGAARSYACEDGVTRYAGALVYARTAAGWVYETALPRPDLYANFGVDVAVDADRIVVGASGGSLVGAPYPAAHVFERTGSGWAYSQRISGPGLGGTTVDISGDTLLVGGLAHGYVPRETFIYEHDGTDWILGQTLGPASNVTIHGDTVVTGQLMQGPAPKARVLRRWNGLWHTRLLRPADGVDGDNFGRTSVVTDGQRVLVGAPLASAGPVLRAGAAYVYDLDTSRPYCTTTPNTTGAHAILRALGCPSVAQDNLSLSATGLPNGITMFVYGDSPAQTPFGSGTRCVGANFLRTRVQDVSGGRATLQVNYHAGNPAREILPDSTWYFQAWFRDGPSQVNTTDGLEITFLP